MAGPRSVIRQLAFGSHKRLSGTGRRPHHKGFYIARTATHPAVLDCPGRWHPRKMFIEELELSPWSANRRRVIDVFVRKSFLSLLTIKANLGRVNNGYL
jgi:hypothetical protein